VRPTREIVIVVLAVAVGSGLVATIVGLLVVEAARPGADVADEFSIAWDVLALMAGIVMGYLLAQLRMNGKHRD
jgi:general stress protein CsbA